VLKGLLVTLSLGSALSIAFVFGAPSLIESLAHNRLLSVTQSAPMFGVSVFSASFTSVSTAGLHTALLGFPDVTIRFNQPTAFFSLPFGKISEKTPTYQVTGSDISIQTGPRSRDEGTISGNRLVIAPVPHSSLERELSYALVVNYQKTPVISLDSISAALPFSSSDPQHALSKGLETTAGAIIGNGAIRAFTSIGGVAIDQMQRPIPLTIKKVGDRHHLTLDRASLEALQLLDPLTVAELDNFEFSPLLFCYVILLRHSAEQFAHRMVSEQSDIIGKTGAISETGLRIAVYGYLVSQVFGAQGGEELGKLYSSGRPEVSNLLPEDANTSPKWEPKALFKLGIELWEKDRTPPRELAKVLLTKHQSPIRKQSAYQPKL
jgi:hypothetical protein